jgi:hypothetical protein
MFRGLDPSLFKGDWSDQKTQSSSNVDQTDSRVGASENAVAIGAGANYQTNDQSDHSFTDQSTVNLITQDQRSYIDNSTTLDAELAKVAFASNVSALQTSAGVLEKQIEATRQTTAKTLESNTRAAEIAADFGNAALTSNTRAAEIAADFSTSALARSTNLATDALEAALTFGTNALDGVISDTEAAREAQTGFLSSFYRDRENTDSKVTGDIIKYAGAAAVVGILAWMVKDK